MNGHGRELVRNGLREFRWRLFENQPPPGAPPEDWTKWCERSDEIIAEIRQLPDDADK